MFCKREDGLKYVLVPFDLAAALMAVICTVLIGCTGWVVAPMLIGLWVGWFAALLLLYALVLFFISLAVNMKKPVEDDHPFFRRVVVFVLALLCRAGRVRIHADGLEKMPDGPFLLVSNHRSSYDPIITVWALRKYDMAFVTKPENLSIPIAGKMIYQANYLPIDRENPRKAMATIQAAANLLTANVASVGVYPEGTRNRGEGLLPFHNAVFKIAQKAGVPVVIAAVQGTEKISNRLPWHHTDVALTICDVIDAESVAAQTTAAIGQTVQTTLERALGYSSCSAING